MAGTRAPFASLAALAAVASAQGEQAGTAAESAKKDLQLLPTVQRPAEASSGKSLFSGSSAVTGLSVATPAAPGAVERNQDGAMPARSANWLLDGVNQLEAEAKAQREAASGGMTAGKSEQASRSDGGGASTPVTANPFTEYLTQWLSPADQALLKASGKSGSQTSTAPWEMPRSDFARETSAPAQAATNPLQMELPGFSEFPASRTAQNPYLAEALQAESTILASKAGASDGRGGAGSLPSILTPSQNVPPAVAPVQASVEQAKAAPSAAPTDRLIDDRKYFPQLRRF